MEPNTLSDTHCIRCKQVLPWGFLHDASLVVVEKVRTPAWTRWMDLLFNPNNELPKCRYCNEVIAAEALVCPHCRRILMVQQLSIGPPALGGYSMGMTFDGEYEAALQALVERFLAEHPHGY